MCSCCFLTAATLSSVQGSRSKAWQPCVIIIDPYVCGEQHSDPCCRHTPQSPLGWVWLGFGLIWSLHRALLTPGDTQGYCSVTVQADKNAGLARESALLEGKCQLKAALSSALESKAEVEAALQTARLDQQRLQQEVCATHDFSPYCCGCQCL